MLEWALDENFDVVFINNADTSTHKYFCPVCRALLTVKNRDFEGRKKLKHYAHYTYTKCLANMAFGETLAHINVKLFLYNKLKHSKTFAAFLKARMGESSQYIEIDILKGVETVELEKQTVGTLIPDISLFSGGKVKRVIEVVVTHEDSEYKRLVYALKGIMCFRIKASDEVYHRLKRGGSPIFDVKGQPISKVLA